MALKRKVTDEESHQQSERWKRSKATPSENGDLSPRERRSRKLQKRVQSDPLPKQIQTRNRRASEDGHNRAKPPVRAKVRRLSQPAEATEQDFALHYARIPVATLRFWYRVRFHEEAPETRGRLVHRLAQDDISRNRNTVGHTETRDSGEQIEAHVEAVKEANRPGHCEQQNTTAGSDQDAKVTHASSGSNERQEKKETPNASKGNTALCLQLEGEPLGIPDPPSHPPRPAQELDSPNLSLEQINEQDPHRNFVRLRNFWLAQHRKSQRPVEVSTSRDEVRYLEHDQIVRAIATLTEALTEAGHKFALTSSNAILMAAAGSDGIAMNLRAVRPRQTLMLPYTFQYAGEGKSTRGDNNHHVLALVEIDKCLKTRKLPRIRLYDSATNLVLKFGKDFRRQLINNIGHTIRNLQWFSWPDDVNPPHSFLEPCIQIQVPVQASKYSCGINAIINGWAVALGLQIRQNTRLDESFDVQARQLVDLALQGFLDTRTIFSFLKCYRYVEADETLRSEYDIRLRRFPRDDDVDDFEEYYVLKRAIEDSQYNR